ncbi:hypothetical protein EMPG_14998 [Blastomyces silverae]|uniref:GPI anchored protein n=1 Tax=Blastomyces silverae TaxID=2060906 RepID=A0A0H1BDX7_9EURO|nr:hypothetical protein EMPG_14998 [Blastomyces silverae]
MRLLHPAPRPLPNHFLALLLCATLQLLQLLLLISPANAATDIANPNNNNISDAASIIARESPVKRDVDIQRRLAGQSPAGVKKMTDDEGEKFWLDYWYFHGDGDVIVGGSGGGGGNGDGDGENIGRKQQRSRRTGRTLDDEDFGGLTGRGLGNGPDNHDEVDAWMNSSIEASLYPPFPLHGNTEYQARGGGGGRGMPVPLLGRSLSRWTARGQDLIFGKRRFKCPLDTEPCTSIDRPNSCCGKGSKCVFVKDTGLGDVGCCGAGERCSGDLTKCANGYSPCPDNPGGIYISTTTVTATPAPPPPPPPPSSTSTEPINPPVRPTSNPITTITTITEYPPPTTPTPTITGCPVGFYACSAIYHGGCCRTGRDCNPTSCPQISSTTIVDDTGATIVLPVDPSASVTFPGGDGGRRRCAGGWTSCAASAGGGCCPDGFVCEQVSCTISAGGLGTAVVGKMAPENGAGRGVVGGDWVYLMMMMVTMAMMIM